MSVRRFLGNTWLSVRETAALLHLSVEATELLLSRGTISCIWRRGNCVSWGAAREMIPYASKQQVEQLELRFDALDAAFGAAGKEVDDCAKV